MIEFDGSIPTEEAAGSRYNHQNSTVTATKRRNASAPVAIRWRGMVPKNSVDTLRARFTRLRDEWLRKIAFTNSMDEIVSNPSYREIVMMGPPVVSLILEDLEAEAKPWFAALREITGADPVKRSSAGDMAAMAQSWLAWGEKNGFR